MKQKRFGTIRKKGFHLSYNAPVTLTFSLLAVLILILDTTISGERLIPLFFTAPGCQGSPMPFNLEDPLDYLRLFTHVLGHKNWSHLLGNMSFILLLGPLLEERYGSAVLALMMTVTAFVTGILNACFINSPLMGASGIAFMMILLASFTSINQKEIPLSFVLILILYLGREFIPSTKNENISTLAHIAGGICGSLFGFLVVPRTKRIPHKKQDSETDGKTPKIKNKKIKKNDDSDATIVGTLDI